jgi:hypothetical protein
VAVPDEAPDGAARRKATFDIRIDKALYPFDLDKATSQAVEGNLKWLGDLSLVPAKERSNAVSGLPAEEPWFPSHNVAHLEAIIASKIIAATIIAAEEQPDVQIREALLDWRDIAGERAGQVEMSTIDALKAAFILITRSLGRTARTVRDKKRHAALDLGGSEVQILAATGEAGKSSKVIDWFTFARKEELEADEAALRDIAQDGPPRALPRTLAADPVFAAGLAVTQRCFGSKDVSAAWKAMDATDMKTRDELKKEHADDVRRAKKKEKKKAESTMIASVCKEMTRQLRTASSSTPAGGGGKGISTVTRPANLKRERDTSDDATQPRPQRSDGAAMSQSQKTAARAIVMAKPASERTATECTRFGLCRRCKEPGHLAAACTSTT